MESAPHDGELALGDDAQIANVEGAAAKHSARYVRERNERLYKAIVLALKYDIPHEEIARSLEVSANLVRAVERLEFSALEEGKKELIGNMRLFQHRAIHRMLNNVDKFKLEALPIALGIVVEKEQLLGGGATQRVEHVSNPAIDGAREKLRETRRKLEAGMVFDAEVVPAKSEAAALPEPTRQPIDLAGQPNTKERETDSESVISES